MSKIKGERICLCEPQSGDAAEITRVLSREEIYATTYGIPKNCDMNYAKWWINFVKSSRKNKTGFEFVIYTHNGRYVGNCAINNISKSCMHGNLTYLIDPKLWGQGYATEAAKLVIKYGFESLGLERISGICMVHNAASEQVLQKAGLTYEGKARHEILKDETFVDVLHYGIIRSDWEAMQR
ncbi:MAG: GNAT family N-acetyltransferase [Oscillospiraceae bacterium]|jgi:RimJ/RimL family protein N-acetyltransferase|nr:GNAT family N-acetyltransferase [Oscillospiraceae bacterium]